MSAAESHGGFPHNRERWEWASREGHRRWITGNESATHFDQTGWLDALRLVRSCPEYRELTVLEWGCGSGRVTQYLCYLFRHVCAVDIAPGMLRLVEERGLPDTSTHLTTGAELPSGLAVDVVYSYLCWMHNRKRDLTPILQSCRNALRPGGRVLFQLPVYEVPRDPVGFSDLACWTPDEMRDLAERTGFEVVSLQANAGAFRIDAIGPEHFALHEFRPRR